MINKVCRTINNSDANAPNDGRNRNQGGALASLRVLATRLVRDKKTSGLIVPWLGCNASASSQQVRSSPLRRRPSPQSRPKCNRNFRSSCSPCLPMLRPCPPRCLRRFNKLQHLGASSYHLPGPWQFHLVDKELSVSSTSSNKEVQPISVHFICNCFG